MTLRRMLQRVVAWSDCDREYHLGAIAEREAVVAWLLQCQAHAIAVDDVISAVRQGKHLRCRAPGGP